MKNGEFESKALAISAGSKYSVWNDSLVVALGMLRNAEGLTLSVVDKRVKLFAPLLPRSLSVLLCLRMAYPCGSIRVGNTNGSGMVLMTRVIWFLMGSI